MYCRNCGSEVNDKAIACPKCGVNPRSEKKFCPSCGVETASNQVACTQCGVSLNNQPFNFDVSVIENIDYQQFIKNKTVLFASIALLACFLPWIRFNMFGIVQNFTFFGLSKMIEMAPGTILVSFLLYFFPLSLLGIIASHFIPQLSPFKKHFSLASIVLVLYIIVGLYMAANSSTSNDSGFAGSMMSSAVKMAKEMISIGFGFYVSVAATAASFVFFKKAQ